MNEISFCLVNLNVAFNIIYKHTDNKIIIPIFPIIDINNIFLKGETINNNIKIILIVEVKQIFFVVFVKSFIIIVEFIYFIKI
jgi:hypothetical protein